MKQVENYGVRILSLKEKYNTNGGEEVQAAEGSYELGRLVGTIIGFIFKPKWVGWL